MRVRLGQEIATTILVSFKSLSNWYLPVMSSSSRRPSGSAAPIGNRSDHQLPRYKSQS